MGEKRKRKREREGKKKPPSKQTETVFTPQIHLGCKEGT